MTEPFEIVMGGDYLCKPDWSRPQGYHGDAHRFYFPRRGRATVTMDGKTTVIEPGRVYFIPGNRVLSYRCDRFLDLHWMHFRALDPYTESRLSRLPGVCVWSARRWLFWKPVYGRMDQLCTERPPALTRRAQAMLLYHVAELLERQARHEASDADAAQLERLRPAIAFMDERHLENPPLSAVAKIVHLSPVYFHRVFTGLLGLTPHDYMLRQRMLRSRRLLEAGELSVKEVAGRSGYDNAFYFSRVFRRYFGQSPRSVRRGGRTVQP